MLVWGLDTTLQEKFSEVRICQPVLQKTDDRLVVSKDYHAFDDFLIITTSQHQRHESVRFLAHLEIGGEEFMVECTNLNLEGQVFKLVFRICSIVDGDTKGFQLNARNTMVDHSDWIHVTATKGEITSTRTLSMNSQPSSSLRPMFYLFVRDHRQARNQIPVFTTKDVTYYRMWRFFNGIKSKFCTRSHKSKIKFSLSWSLFKVFKMCFCSLW